MQVPLAQIVRLGMQRAKALIYLRLRAEKPFISGKVFRKSDASLSISNSSTNTALPRALSRSHKLLIKFKSPTLLGSNSTEILSGMSSSLSHVADAIAQQKLLFN